MRTKKGKRFAGSFGNIRTSRTGESTTVVASAPVEKKETVKKAPAKKAAPKKKAAEKE
jgi:hypothetical protein